jgi:hypothetical protein
LHRTDKCITIKSDLFGKVSKFSSSKIFNKSANAIEHDAECIAVIEHLQKKNAPTAIESKTVFLTSDWSIIRLQRNDFEYRDKIDVAVLPSQMMQIFCLTAPITDYLEAFLGLFSSSRTSFGNVLDNAQIQEIMGRVAMYKGTTPAFAEKVLTNQLIQTSFANKETEEEKNALIEDAMIEEVETKEAAIELKDNEICDKTQELKHKEDENKDKTDEICDLSRRIENLERTYKQSEDKLSHYNQYFANQAERISSLKAVFRFGGGLILLALGVMMVMLCVAAILPLTSTYVEPCFSWMGTSKTIADEDGKLIGIIALIAAIGLGLIPSGWLCVKPGYPTLKKIALGKQQAKINVDNSAS